MTQPNPAPQHALTPPWRRGSVLPSWVLLMFVLKVLAVVLVAVVSYQGLQARFASANRTTRTLETLRRLESVLSLLKDAETGERGYLITGQERYLEPFDVGKASIASELSALRGYLFDNPQQLDRFARFQKLAEDKLAQLDRTVSRRRAGDMEGVRLLIPEGKTLMDAARQLVREMADTETETLQANLDDQSRLAGGLRLLIAGGAALILCLIVVSAFATSRTFRYRDVQAWVRGGRNLLSDRLQGEQRLEQLGDKIVRFLAEYLEARVGAVHAVTVDGRLVRCGAFAMPGPDRAAPGVGEGLIGQAVRERRTLHLADIPPGYLQVTSSVGAAGPREVVIVPAVADGATVAVVELGFFRKVGAGELDLLDQGALPVNRIQRAHCRSICGEIHSGFATLRASLPVNLKGHFPGFKIWTRAQADIDRVCTIWRDCLAESGGPFLFGERTMADAMYAPVVTRFATYDVKLEPLLQTYANLIMNMPEMVEWIAAAKEEPAEIEELEVEY